MSRYIFIVVIAVLFSAVETKAQFKKEAFTQSYNDDSGEKKDSTDKLFTFKDYFGGLAHKHKSKIGVVFAGSTVFVGGQQIYNSQYLKLPIIYGSIIGSASAGLYFHSQWKKSGDTRQAEMSKIMFGISAFCYWATLMDGVISFKDGKYPHPGKATLYSVLLPGLGQAYNKEFWKIPIYYAGLIGAAHYTFLNHKNYIKYKNIYNEASTNPNYSGRISSETALYYRNTFRRLRDYSIVAFAGFYLLQVIDANVFSYMHDFELTDDISVSISPTIIDNEIPYVQTLQENVRINNSEKLPSGTGFGRNGFAGPGFYGPGIKIGLTF